MDLVDADYGTDCLEGWVRVPERFPKISRHPSAMSTVGLADGRLVAVQADYWLYNNQWRTSHIQMRWRRTPYIGLPHRRINEL